MTKYRLIRKGHKKMFKNRHNGESPLNDQIKEMIWLDPEIPPKPLPLGLTRPRNITQEKNNKNNHK